MSAAPTNARLEEITALRDSPSLVPGPIDIEDMKLALLELIGRRETDLTHPPRSGE